jgi:WD40 repeat protein/DNA-binding SARP family transcriptional activator
MIMSEHWGEHAQEADMAHLSLSLLGTFQAMLDGRPVTGFESNKVRALLAYLAAEADRPHSRQTLAGLLWPDYPDRSALNNLRSALANLRQAIGDRQAEPPFLIITRDTLQFNLASDVALDVSALQGLSGLKIDQLERVIDAGRGSFLEGFSLGDSPPFEEWVLFRREQINRQTLEALQRLAVHFEEAGDYHRASLYARRRLELEPWGEETHRQLMRALALSGQRSAALAQYEACCQLLKQELDVEPARETTALYESLRDETFPPAPCPGLLEAAAVEPPAPGDPPYKGLDFFDEVDADLFFGREDLTAQLVRRVRDCLAPDDGGGRVLTVIGASGSGKSSIVRAGLIPALKGKRFPGDAQSAWPAFLGPIHVITPTAHPLEALALSLTRAAESVTATATLMEDLAHDPRSLHLAATCMAQPMLLVVDQFEELFSLCHAEGERKAFVDNLLYAAQAAGPTLVIIVLRADYYAQCAPYENLRQALCRRQLYIGAMPVEALRRAIEEPARSGGWVLEPGLVEVLLRAVGDEPGALPLLSHALLETWRQRRGGALTLAGYEASGGVHGAIARTAEALFGQLTPEQQAVTRHIFLQLTEPGIDQGDLLTLDTRRRAGLAELTPHPEDAGVVRTVLERLADARLITIAQETVEVAHEALIREWTRLREWLNDNREGLRLHRRLTEAAQEWKKLNRDTGALYRGARLAQAQEWADAHPAEPNRYERDFLEASLAEQQAQQAAEVARQQRELEAAQTLARAQRQRAEAEMRRAVTLTLALGASVVFLATAVGLGLLANRNAQAAGAQARLAASRELAAAAVNNLQVDPERSVWLALQGLAAASTLEAGNALHQALPELHSLQTILAHRQTPGAAFSPDGGRLASIGVDGEVKVWDAATYQLVLTLPGEPGDVGFDAAFSPDGKLLAASRGTQLIVWDAASGQKLFALAGDLSGPTVNHLSFSPDSRRLAVANMEGTPKVWDVATRAETLSLTGHTAMCESLAYSSDGKSLATGDQSGAVKIWEAAAGRELLTLQQGGMIHGVAFSPDGTRLASASDDGKLVVWEVASGQALLSLPTKSGLYDVAFMPDGQRLVGAHQDGTVTVWDAASGQQLLVLAGHVSTVVAVAVNPDNRRLATAGYDGTLRLWDTAPGREVLTLAAHTGLVNDIAYSPDGSRLATAGFDGALKLWDPASGLLALSLTPNAVGGGLTGLTFSPDGRRLAAGSGSGIVYVGETGTSQAMVSLVGHGGAVYGLAFSPDGTRLATASWDGSAKTWDLAAGKELVTFSHHAKNALLFGVAFSSDGKRVFTGGTDGYVREWDALTGQELHTYAGAGQEVYGVALSPDGKRLAIGWENGAVTIWDLASGKKGLEFTGHAGLVLRLAFSRDGTRLASASFDKSAKVWDAQTGAELATLYGNTSNVFGVSFSPEGAYLATAGGDGTARIYALQGDELVRLARSRVTRVLTVEECRKYLHVDACPAIP